MAVDPLTAGLIGVSAIPTLFGSGGGVSVPGSIAQPTDPTSKFVDEQGKLREGFQTAGLTNESLESGKGLLGNLRSRALATGPSQSAQHLLGASDIEQQAQRDQLGRDSASQLAGVESSIARTGGLGSGARERLAQTTANQNLVNNQNINRQGSLNRLNTLAQDEQNKLGILKDLPGQFQSFGNEQLNRQVSDRQGGANLLFRKFESDNKAFAANQIARAQANAQNASSKGLLSGLF